MVKKEKSEIFIGATRGRKRRLENTCIGIFTILFYSNSTNPNHLPLFHKLFKILG